MKSDIEIAREAKLKDIGEIAEKLGLTEDDISRFGKYKAKVNHRLLEKLKDRKDAKLVLVTAINPTPAGEGKTTTTVGLGDALNRLGKKAMVALREPSLGPVFGVKGGAAGGGYAQVVPMEDINLHFTGDLHAVTAANNLLAAMTDNHIYHGNSLNIDPRRITFKRVMDMNDRQLRFIVNGLGGKANGVPREDGFDITAASEVMAVLCLSKDLEDLKGRLSNIIVGYSYDGNPVKAADLKAQGAMAALLKDAINPNLVQTIEGNPAFVHGGPFANIAHGCNTLIATKLAMKLSDIVVTEAGFGADLGAEKFLDIKCRIGGMWPDAVVIVASIRALKLHGGAAKESLNIENLDALKKGVRNLEKHIENIKDIFNIPAVVAINQFPSDTQRELDYVKKFCEDKGVYAEISKVFSEGGKGGEALAHRVLELIEIENDKKDKNNFLYPLELSIKEKIEIISNKIYGAIGVDYTKEAERDIEILEKLGYSKLPICMAKTQYSLSDNPKLLGRPEGFKITVRQVKISAGAGFIVAITGEIMTMPGLSKVPAAEKIDIDKEGNIFGLF